MHRAALLAFGVLLASAGLAAAQGLPEGIFASTKEGCAKLKQTSAAELGDDIDFTILNKSGFNARPAALRLRHRDRAQRDQLAGHPRFARSRAIAYPDLFAILEEKNGDLRVTRMTVQQPSYDQTEEEPELSLDDLDPSEIGRDEGAGGSDDQAPEEALPEPEPPGEPQHLFPLRKCEAQVTKLTDLTIAEAREGLRDKSFSARELTQAHVEAIEAANGALNAFVLPTPERALDMAKASDARRKKGEAGALEGIPLGIKDLFCHQGRAHHRLLAHSRRLHAHL